MDVAAFDAWRAGYDAMSYAEQVAFYNQVEVDHPHQVHFDASAFLRFLEFAGMDVWSFGNLVVEIGGWKGELAQAMLAQSPWIVCWVNYEISERARDLTVCTSPRYTVVVPGDFVWRVELVEADVLVMSHTIEHLKARDLAALWDNLPAPVRFIGLQAPIEASVTGKDWTGYWGTHILEIGWAQVAEQLAARGFALIEDLTVGDFRAFARVQ